MNKSQLTSEVFKKFPTSIGDTTIRQMNGRERLQYYAIVKKAADNPADDSDAQIIAALLVRCLANEDGSRMYRDGDTDNLIDTMSGTLADELFIIAREFNAFKREQIDQKKTN